GFPDVGAVVAVIGLGVTVIIDGVFSKSIHLPVGSDNSGGELQPVNILARMLLTISLFLYISAPFVLPSNSSEFIHNFTYMISIG
ncbi:hypothetical protein, partial [Pectobacterium versatile]|uniref:hypothetical protein n=1 Tax=Pectobacterium versatile TaxID=2488639 RepID=UPI001F1E1F68